MAQVASQGDPISGTILNGPDGISPYGMISPSGPGDRPHDETLSGPPQGRITIWMG